MKLKNIITITLIILGLYLIFTFSQKLDKPMTVEEAKVFCEKEIMNN